VRLYGLLIGSAVSLSGCATPSYTAADAAAETPVLTEKRRIYMFSELEQKRLIWAESKPKKYRYEFSNLCFCFPETDRGPHRLVVENDIVISSVYVGEATDGDGEAFEARNDIVLRNPIESLFASIEKRLRPTTPIWPGPDSKVFFTVKYDDTMGFPTEISYDVENVYDIWNRRVIENFEIIE
jgi:hypothetical protein